MAACCWFILVVMRGVYFPAVPTLEMVVYRWNRACFS
nr:MAG TPA: hypothetical protein [Caudoviricetes sp.]